MCEKLLSERVGAFPLMGVPVQHNSNESKNFVNDAKIEATPPPARKRIPHAKPTEPRRQRSTWGWLSRFRTVRLFHVSERNCKRLTLAKHGERSGPCPLCLPKLGLMALC